MEDFNKEGPGFNHGQERGQYESQAKYLARAGEVVTRAIREERGQGKPFVPILMFERRLSPVVRELITKIMSEALRGNTPEGGTDNTSALSIIKEKIMIHLEQERARKEKSF